MKKPHPQNIKKLKFSYFLTGETALFGVHHITKYNYKSLLNKNFDNMKKICIFMIFFIFLESLAIAMEETNDSPESSSRCALIKHKFLNFEDESGINLPKGKCCGSLCCLSAGGCGATLCFLKSPWAIPLSLTGMVMCILCGITACQDN